ncbi:prepilin-type N-terminal cleavage/methylation domain-containing protein [Luteolibacter sp. SL250]|uniref:prepilin-type N-terminal cleavage/methylation domain-containing protein n=1 Tax=Luteolibacter sp. SL250 TaxID=2995170 RepID=UPI0022716E27|nr:prepilin-type N-terminal cleavage/methylation domain-containing protein [Luteolibacter sp. SL250]WAC19467.1 prepilin-type N-terminal cleavage/methylation domain-containing protein [Luteolibacter sp. SL250]
MKRHPSISRKQGFTLLELVISIAMSALLIGMVVQTANTSLQLGNSVVKSQNEEMLRQSFIELLDRRLTSLPGNTRFDVKVTDNGSQYESTITLQKVPLSFAWGNQERVAKAVTLSTVRTRSGYFDIVLSYYENEILDDASSRGTGGTSGSVALSKEPFAQIVLLSNLRYFEWRFLDGTNLEWRYDWDLQGRLPLQIELVFAIGASGEEIRQVFWLPPKQNPEILAREMMQNSGGGTIVNPGGNGGGNNNGNGGGNNNNNSGGGNSGGSQNPQ